METNSSPPRPQRPAFSGRLGNWAQSVVAPNTPVMLVRPEAVSHPTARRYAPLSRLKPLAPASGRSADQGERTETEDEKEKLT